MMIKDKKTINEIYNNIRLINYNRGLTIFENNLIIEQPKKLWRDTADGKESIKALFASGHSTRDGDWTYADSSNLAYNMASVQTIRYLNEKMMDYHQNFIDPKLKVCIKGLGGGNPSAGALVYDSFSIAMLDDLKKKMDFNDGSFAGSYDTNLNWIENKNPRTVGSTFLLWDFYFNFGKIMNVIKSAGDNYNNYLFPDGVYNFFGQLYDTTFVSIARDNIIANNKYYRPYYNSSGQMSQKSSDVSTVITPEKWNKMVRDTTEVLHVVLPIAAVALCFIPGGVLLGASLEFIDAMLYQFVDDDPYMAGISIIFTVIGLKGAMAIPGVKNASKEALKEIMERLAKKQTLNETQEITLREILSNKKLLNEAGKYAMVKFLIDLLKKNVLKFINVIRLLAKKGFMKIYDMNIIIHMVIGTFAFDYYASIYLKPCSKTLSFDDLLELLLKTKKYNFEISLLQPFTQTPEECELLVTQKLIKQRQEELEKMRKDINQFNDICCIFLNYLIKNNISLSMSTRFSNDNAILQSILVHLDHYGNTNIIISCDNNTIIIYNSSIIEKVDIFSTTKKIETILNKNSDGELRSKYKPPSVAIIKLHIKGIKEPKTIKYMCGTNIDYEIVYNKHAVYLSPKYGFFDKQTELAVESFQKKYKLVVDGIAGKETLKKMLYLLENKYGKSILNKSGIDFFKTDTVGSEIDKKTVNNFINSKDEKLVEIPPPDNDTINKVDNYLQTIQELFDESRMESNSTITEIQDTIKQDTIQ